MSKTTAQVSALRMRQAAEADDFESYQAWEAERRMRDEVTDAAERIRAPLERDAEFFLSGYDLVSDLGESLGNVIDFGIEDARWRAAEDPDWAVELERRVIDREEKRDAIELAKRGEGAMIAFLIIPDVVRAGESSLPGYNRQRLKMFVRITVAAENGVKIRYLSLDGSDRDGVAAMDSLLGHEFDHSLSSEDVARRRRFLDGPDWDAKLLGDMLRDAYDGALAEKHGGEWRAGRPAGEAQEAIRFIRSQPDLIAAHMDIINKIFILTEDAYERNKMAEPHRFNFAVALDDRMHGKVVAASQAGLQDAGDVARVDGRKEEYEPDCPPAGSKIANQARSVGFKGPSEESEMKWGNCPICGTRVKYAVCAPVFGFCGAKKSNGFKPVKLLAKQALGHHQVQPDIANRPKVQAGEVRRLDNGQTVRFERRIAIGSTDELVVDVDSGQIIAERW